MSPKVTIIVPTYNRYELLKKCMKSLLEQTYNNIEIIVINNGSQDNSSEYLNNLKEKDNRIKLIEFEKNTGSPYACYNAGIKEATGEYMTFMYDDDMLVHDAVETIMKKFELVDYDWICANCINPDSNNFTFLGINSDKEVTFDDMLCEKYTGEGWSIFKRELLGDLKFDESIYGGESIVWLKMYKKSPAYYTHKGLRIYYKHSSNYTSVDSYFNNSLKVLKAHETYFAEFESDYRRLGVLKNKKAKILFLKSLNSISVSFFQPIRLLNKGTAKYILLTYINFLSPNLSKQIIKLLYRGEK